MDSRIESMALLKLIRIGTSKANISPDPDFTPVLSFLTLLRPLHVAPAGQEDAGYP
jgi:hypothetical protein